MKVGSERWNITIDLLGCLISTVEKTIDIVQGITSKSHWNPFKNKNYEAVRASLNKKVTVAKKIEKDSYSIFMETFYRATKELINSKLKN